MLSWIGRLFRSQSAVEKRRRNPVLATTIEQSALIYSRIPLHQFIDESRRSELARAIYLEVHNLCNTRDSAASCREKFVAAMLKLASYQVLVIPAAPQDDPFGLRQLPGITAELRPYLDDLVQKNDDLRAAFYRASDGENELELWQFVQREYWESHWLLETLNVARIALENTSSAVDWKQAFLHAASVNSEQRYRWDLQLPSAFDKGIAREAATAYSVFTDIVVSGSLDPTAEWRDYYRESEIPMPEFD